MHSSTISFLFALALTLSATATPVVSARDGDMTFGEGNVARDVMNDLEARHRRKGGKGGFGFGGRKGGQKGGAGQGQAGKGGAAGTGAAPPATTTAAQTGGKGGAATGGNGAAAAPPPAVASDPQALQSSTTIDPACIQTTDDGQNPPVAGQSPADISKNNSANACALGFPTVPLTNGLQITTGSCNPIPIGNIPSVDNMPSSKFQSPKNLDTIASNTTFTVVLATTGIQLGTFTNAQKTYFGNPQKLNAKGQIIGHTHIVMEAIDSLTTTKLTNPKNFIFFKGVNTPQDAQGNVQVDVTGGVGPGVYRMCTIVSSQTHQPAIVPVAQHGSLDDCVYFTATPGGTAAAGGKGAAAGAGAAATGAAAATGNGKAAATGTGKNAQATTGKNGKGTQAAQPVKAQPATAKPAAKAQTPPAKPQAGKAASVKGQGKSRQ